MYERKKPMLRLIELMLARFMWICPTTREVVYWIRDHEERGVKQKEQVACCLKILKDIKESEWKTFMESEGWGMDEEGNVLVDRWGLNESVTYLFDAIRLGMSMLMKSGRLG